MNQKEESISLMQDLGIFGPDGLPNKEKFDWKTIPQGAATYVVQLSSPLQLAYIFLPYSTVAAAFDPRISGRFACFYFQRLNPLPSFPADKPGSYLDDSKVANEAVASHSSDPVRSIRFLPRDRLAD
jgi:hypothetical protein